jgi:TRAP transporter TAXI family solute receptor
MIRKKMVLAIIAVAVAVMTCGAAFAAPAVVSIATGGTSGTYYPIGGAIAAAVSKGDTVRATAETGNASVANINLIAQGEIDIAMVQNDITSWAYKGELMFEGKPLTNVRAIAALYPEHLQLVITKESGIKALADLKGKRVGVGAPGSGVEGDVRAVFQVAGLKYDDMRVDFLDFGATSSRFKDNQIDAGFVVAGYPTAAIMDLTTTKDVALLNFDKETMDKISAAHPYFVSSIIPSGTYRGIDTDTTTPAVMAILVTHDGVAEDVIYNFTKNLYTNIADVQGAHAMARNIKLETALDGLTAPLHPGAAKYFKEAGLKVD